MTRPKALFFAKVRTEQELHTIGFYRQDLQILADLGYDVEIAIRPRLLPPADLYFGWWWSYAFLPVLASKLRRRPCVITGVFNFWRWDARPWWEKKLMAFGANGASANIAISQDELGDFRRLLPRAPMHFSPLGLDNAFFTPGDKPRQFFVYTTATMTPINAERKGIPQLIKAAKLVHDRIPEIRFVLAGECHPDYLAMAEREGILGFTEFPGIISEQQKLDYLRTCAVYAQPTRYEGFGLGILEAMSCAAPVLSCRVGAVPEVLGEAGRLMDDMEPQTIAANLVAMLEDGPERARMGRAARRRVLENYSYERRREDIRRVIAAVTKGKNKTVQPLSPDYS